MKRAYIIIGELEDTNMPDIYYSIVHSIKRAEELCAALEEQSSNHIYYWRECIEEEDD